MRSTFRHVKETIRWKFDDTRTYIILVSRGLNFAWHRDMKIARSQNLSSSITIHVCLNSIKFRLREKKKKIRVVFITRGKMIYYSSN